MLLFRSEEHIQNWCQQWRQPRGENFNLTKAWQLAQVWYHDRLEKNWRRKTVAEAEKIFAELGFDSPFWQLQ